MQNNPPERFELSNTDKASHVWQVLLVHLNKSLDDLRKQNDGKLDELTTAHLRGRIATLKRLIELDNDLPIID